MLRPLLAVAAAALCTLAPSAQTVPAGFTVDTVVGSGISAPLDFAFLPDGRMLIANRTGDVSLFVDGLPVGLQVIGKPFDEAMMLRVASAHEALAGIQDEHPSL